MYFNGEDMEAAAGSMVDPSRSNPLNEDKTMNDQTPPLPSKDLLPFLRLPRELRDQV
jgi:hypothetical protein